MRLCVCLSVCKVTACYTKLADSPLAHGGRPTLRDVKDPPVSWGATFPCTLTSKDQVQTSLVTNPGLQRLMTPSVVYHPRVRVLTSHPTVGCVGTFDVLKLIFCTSTRIPLACAGVPFETSDIPRVQ